MIFLGIVFVIIWKFFTTTIKSLCWSASIKEAHNLNKKFFNFDNNYFWKIVFICIQEVRAYN